MKQGEKKSSDVSAKRINGLLQRFGLWFSTGMRKSEKKIARTKGKEKERGRKRRKEEKGKIERDNNVFILLLLFNLFLLRL